jgi:hypothetical protein
MNEPSVMRLYYFSINYRTLDTKSVQKFQSIHTPQHVAINHVDDKFHEDVLGYLFAQSRVHL